MILECPSCGTYYDTPAVIPPEGRKVRCAKCANVWLAMPAPSETGELPDEPEPIESDHADTDLSGQTSSEPEDTGEAALSDGPAGDEAPDEVVAEDETEDSIVVEIDESGAFGAEEQTDADFSVEDEEPEPDIEEAPVAALARAAAEDAAAEAEMAESGEELAEEAGEALAGDESAAESVAEDAVAEEQADAVIAGEAEEPDAIIGVARVSAYGEAAPEDAAGVAELAEPSDTPEQIAADNEVDSEDAAFESEPVSDTAQAEVDAPEPEDVVDAAEVGEAEAEAENEEQPPPEADYPIGDFSHQGMGPARSPMQEILTAASGVQTAEPVSDQDENDEEAGNDQSPPPEAAISDEARVIVAAAMVETVDTSFPEAAEPADAAISEAEAEGSDTEAETQAREPIREESPSDDDAVADQPAMAAAAAAAGAGKDFQPTAGQLVSWGGLAILVVVGFILAVANRETIVRTMPGSAPFYSGLGMAVNLRGLDFENVTSTWTTEADQPVLEVRGEIVNIGEEPLTVPIVVFALQDENGVEVHQWQAEVTSEPLEAGGRTQFTARIPSPPASSRTVQVKFAGAP